MIIRHRVNIRLLAVVVALLIFLLIGLKGPFLISSSARAGKSLISGIFQQRQTKPEVRHIGFLKVHKCASTTILNILYRFGLKRDLNFVIPIRGNYIHFHAKSSAIREIPPPFGQDYDILCNHVPKFDNVTFSTFLPDDSVYIAIVREPFDRMKSAFHYYRNEIKMDALLQINTTNPFKTYIKRPKFYESKWGDGSFTNNKMAFDFGFPVHRFQFRKDIKNWIKYIDGRFDLVMVSEYFDESLVLMRRMLNWSIRDIIYLRINSNPQNNSTTRTVTKRLKPYLELDYMFYEYFLRRLKMKMAREGQGFREEVAYFKTVIQKNAKLCSENIKRSVLEFPANEFHEYFNVGVDECEFIYKPENNFLKLVRDTQVEKVIKYGANVTRLIT